MNTDKIFNSLDSLASSLEKIKSSLKEKGFAVPDYAKYTDLVDILKNDQIDSYVMVVTTDTEGNTSVSLYDKYCNITMYEDVDTVDIYFGSRSSVSACEFCPSCKNCNIYGPCNISCTFQYADSMEALLINDEFNVPEYNNLFASCTGMKRLSLPDGFGGGAVDYSGMFKKCISLQQLDIRGKLQISNNLDLSYSPLSSGSVHTLLNALPVVEGCSLTLSETAKNEIRAKDLDLVKSNGWSIS